MKVLIRFIHPWCILVLGVSLSAGGCFLPPAANVQDARTVGKGQVRAAGYWSGLNDTDASEGESAKLADEFGGIVGVGVSESAELQLRLERLDYAEESDGYQFVSFSPKFGLVADRLAVMVPIGLYFGEDVEWQETFQIQPAIIGSVPVSEKFEVNMSGRVALPFNSDLYTWGILGFGVGLSSDLDRWAILPEISYSIALDDDTDEVSNILGYGLALTFYFGEEE
jgi:hypothetical protein